MAEIDIEKLKNDRDELRQQLVDALAQYHQIEGAISALDQIINKLEDPPIQEQETDNGS
jgi:predicted  nucleic acid-binding Zn-ribbon protein